MKASSSKSSINPAITTLSSDELYISIDMRRSSIRIYKKTLEKLHNPSFINILVNPEKKLMAIKPAPADNTLAERLHYRHETKQKYAELYSRTLINKIKLLCSSINEERSYQVNGYYSNSHMLITYDLNTMIPSTNTNSKSSKE